MILQGQSNREKINKAIKVPHKLYTADDRVLRVRSWKPTVEHDQVVSVTVDCIIELDTSFKIIKGEIVSEEF